MYGRAENHITRNIAIPPHRGRPVVERVIPTRQGLLAGYAYDQAYNFIFKTKRGNQSDLVSFKKLRFHYNGLDLGELILN